LRTAVAFMGVAAEAVLAKAGGRRSAPPWADPPTRDDPQLSEIRS